MSGHADKAAKLMSVRAWRFTVVALLLLSILLQWYWINNKVGSTDRRISVDGSAVIEAAPDKFLFYPQYQSENTDTVQAQKEVSTKATEVTSRLKELGVPAERIAVSQSSYDSYRIPTESSMVTSASVTITVDSFELAQKVQDYLVTTGATGQLTPQASFSEEKRKTLEREGRAKATEDAKRNAEQNAEQLGARLGKVVSVTDGYSGGVYPMMGVAEDAKAVSSSDGSASSGFVLQPGLNEITYSVQVVYELR